MDDVLNGAADKITGALQNGELGDVVNDAVDKVTGALNNGELGDAVTGVIDQAADGIEKLSTLSHISSGVIVAVLALIFIFLLSKPIKTASKILINTGLGFVALILVNIIGREIGVELEVSWLNALVTGVFGIPGVAVLFLIKWMSV